MDVATKSTLSPRLPPAGVSFKAKSKKKTLTDALKLMKSVKRAYFKLLDYSINQIFLTSRSDFRVGFVASTATFVVAPKAFNGFHIDRFDSLPASVTHSPGDAAKTYNSLTKLTLKLDESGAQSLQFQLGGGAELVSDEEGQLKSENLPKIVELAGYAPSLLSANDDSVTGLAKEEIKASKCINQEHKIKTISK